MTDRMPAAEAAKRIRATLKRRAEHAYRVTIYDDGSRYGKWRGVKIDSTRPHPNTGTGYGWDKHRDRLSADELAELGRLFKLSPSDERLERGWFVLTWHELDAAVETVEDESDELSAVQKNHRVYEAFKQCQHDAALHVETREEIEERHRREENERYKRESAWREYLGSTLAAHGWDVEQTVQTLTAAPSRV